MTDNLQFDWLANAWVAPAPVVTHKPAPVLQAKPEKQSRPSGPRKRRKRLRARKRLCALYREAHAILLATPQLTPLKGKPLDLVRALIADHPFAHELSGSGIESITVEIDTFETVVVPEPSADWDAPSKPCAMRSPSKRRFVICRSDQTAVSISTEDLVYGRRRAKGGLAPRVALYLPFPVAKAAIKSAKEKAREVAAEGQRRKVSDLTNREKHDPFERCTYCDVMPFRSEMANHLAERHGGHLRRSA